MDIRGETIQNGEPSPEHPVEIENKTNILLAIEILKKLKSKVTLVKVDDENNSEKEYRLPFLMNIEQQAIETVLSELEKKDKRLNRQFKLLQKKDKKIEELKADDSHQWEERCKLTFELEKKDKEYEELTEASKELCKTVNLMKKVINEMAEYIIDLIKYNNSEEERDKEEIKEYFTKKAEKGE